MNLRGKRVLVMGLGVHGGGLGVARWLLSQGAAVTVTDMAGADALAEPISRLDAAAAALGASVAYTLGEHRPDDFTRADMVVANPAVRPDSPWLALATQAGVPVETEMTLFFRACPGPILGVTGTKGKTTTALLLAAMLRERYPDTVAAGNLRVSALEALGQISPTTPVVLELSSFQLERLGAAGLSPRYSLITNLSADHINWHGSMEAYAAAKRQIFLHQGSDGVAVLNGADPTLVGWAESVPGRLIWFAPQSDAIEPDGRAMLFYGERGLLWRPPEPQAELERLAARADLRLAGDHNLANAAAAAALARGFGLDTAAIVAGLRGFAGVEHRLERVRELDGVAYVNDTTATNPVAALAALAAIDTPIVLIAGGADKQLEFEDLGAAIARRAKALVLLAGSATSRLREAVIGSLPADKEQPPTVLGPYDNFAAAVSAARALAQPGDTVLLSPGCASFGMFRNEFHRGEEFRRIVSEL